MRQLSVAIGVAFVLGLGCAHSQDLKAAQACTRLGDDASRLACYDAALGRDAVSGHDSVSGAAKPPTAPQPGAVNSETSVKFGDDGRLHPHPKADLPKNLTAQVQQVTPLRDGHYRLTLDNGQVWSTTQADSALTFKASDTVTISRLLLGGYEVSLAGHTTSVSAIRMK